MQELETIIAQSNFWLNPAPAYQILQDIEYLIFSRQEKYQNWCAVLEDIKAAVELLQASTDEQLWQETQLNLKHLKKELEIVQIQKLLSHPYDQMGALVTITAEIAGADAQDWAYLLMKLYWNWGRNHNYQVNLVEIIDGDSAGINFATLEITGRYAYGFLKSETGIHKLQRISPFQTNGNLQTILARVEVIPVCDAAINWEIPEHDLKITQWRWHGKNLKRSQPWVKVCHIPTGITVFCDQERSQMQNQTKALGLIKSKLWFLMQSQSVQDIAKIETSSIKSLSTKPIREYILHPENRVKDLRTNVETTSVTEVLNGEINFLIEAYLQQQSMTHS
ncbi:MULTISPECIES: PCRF domain-containing protein [unclassified Calothrix]|uniref:PCRF domain-containing protein n=1 Tax=unclassified Calothrix TaxID=2619626 RepID=UPI0028C44B26|nr:PCRF domain-containing protein [Calothrix sp. FACHB-168]